MRKKRLKKHYMIKATILSQFEYLLHYFLDKNDLSSSFYRDLVQNCLQVEQVHGNNIVLADGKKKFYKNADGLITTKKMFLGIRTADCLPVFLFEPKNKIIGAIHAGWKGLVGNIIDHAVNQMSAFGAVRKEILAGVGPHIGSCCYQISDNLIIELQKYKINLTGMIISKEDLWYMDLSKLAYQQIMNAGLIESHIEILSICTACHENYYSYRRDGKETGRMFNIIGF